MRQEIGLRSYGRGVFQKPAVSIADLGTKRVYEIHEGDLLISTVFAWEGAVAIAGAEDRGLVGSHRFMTWVPRCDDVYAPFIRDYLLSAPGLDAMGQASPGSAGRNRTLGIEALKAIEIPLPDLGTQRAIAVRLDRIGRVANAAPSEHISTLRSRLLLDALEGARERHIGTFVTRRKQPIEVSETQSYKMLGMRNRGRGAFDAGLLHGSETKYPRLLRVHAGDLIYLKLGAWEGAFGIVPPELDGRHTSPEFVSYEVDEDQIDRDFLEAMVTWDAFAFRVGGLSKGTNLRRRRLNPDVFESLSIPLPTLERQRELGRTLLQLRRAGAQIARRDELTHALLPAARNEAFRKLLAR